MKCIICAAEIDELKTFPDVVVAGRPVSDDLAKAKHAEALSLWEQVTVSVLRDGGNKQVLVGMTCPADRLESVTISKGGK